MSLDSDIQFLGNWSLKALASASTWVSAIVLTPVKSDDATPEAPLTFSREATSVVHVGRNSINEVPSHSADRAVFTSPVMSRSHAKITFSDSGSVYIIDTGSYHGTWVARASEPEKFKLEAEDSLQLRDGDILTFGKEVIKDDILHKPVTLSVKLLHSSQPPAASPMSISPPEFGIPSPKPSRNTFGLQTTTDEDGSCDDSHDEESDDDESQETSMSPSLPPGQIEAFGSSISTGDDSSSSEADNEPEPLIPDVVPTSSSPLAPLTPPWHRLPSIFSGSLGRLGSPNKSPRTPSAAGRFERLIFGRSFSGGGTDDILSSEARVSEIAHEDLGRMSYNATHHHHGHHHNHHCHPLHNHDTHEQVTLSHNCNTAADVSKLSERIDELVKEVQTVKENSEGLNTLRDTVNATDEKLKGSLAPLKVDIMMLQSHKSAVQMDIKFLRADLEARGANVETVRDELEKRVHDVREQAVEIQASLESVQDDLVTMKEENVEMITGINDVRVDVGALEAELRELRGALNDIEAFRVHSGNAMKDIRMETEKAYEEMSEKIKSEVKQMLEEHRESTVTQVTQVLGKRKRSDDDEGSPEEPNDPGMEDVKSRVGTTNKRARLVTRLVTAGAIGAVGAWLGLAYL